MLKSLIQTIASTCSPKPRSRYLVQLNTVLLAFTTSVPTSWATSLTDVYELAIKNDPVIASAEATAAAGKTIGAQALAELLPRINGSYIWTRRGATTNLFSGLRDRGLATEEYNVTLNQNLFNLQAYYGYRQAQSNVQQTALEYSAAQQELIVRTASAYFNVLRAEDNLTSAQAEERAIARQLEQTQQRYEVGLIAITDVHEAQAAFDLTVAERLGLEAAVGIAKESLSQITSVPIDVLDRLSDRFVTAPPEPADVAAWVNYAEQNNLQIQLAEQRLEQSKRNAQVKDASFAPTVTGFANYDRARNTIIPGRATERDAFGIRAEWELFRGGAKWAERKQAGYQRVAAQADLVAATRGAVGDTRSLYLETTTDAARVRARKRAIVSSTSALDATQAGYDAGTRNIVDLLNAQRDLYAAERDYANARYDYIINSLRLKQASGIISPDDLKAIPLQQR